MNIILETERLALREWTTQDAGALFAICSDPETMNYIGDRRAWTTIERAHQWLGRVVARYESCGYAEWAVVKRENGEVIGSCGFGPLYGGPEINFGYLFGREHWGKGFATEAARACLRYGFEKLNFEEIAAVVLPEHLPSRRVLEKIGFEYRGLRRFAGEDEDDAYYVANRSAVETCSPVERPC